MRSPEGFFIFATSSSSSQRSTSPSPDPGVPPPFFVITQGDHPKVDSRYASRSYLIAIQVLTTSPSHCPTAQPSQSYLSSSTRSSGVVDSEWLVINVPFSLHTTSALSTIALVIDFVVSLMIHILSTRLIRNGSLGVAYTPKSCTHSNVSPSKCHHSPMFFERRCAWLECQGC